MVLTIDQDHSLASAEIVWTQAPQAMQNQLHGLAAVSIVFLMLTTVAFSLRVYARGFILKRFGSDDWAMLAAVLCFMAFSAGTAALAYKMMPIADALAAGMQPVSDGINFLLIFVVCMYAATMIAFKFSLGFLFVGLFGNQKTFKYIIYVSVVMSAVLGVINIVWSVGRQCQVLTQFFPGMQSCRNHNRDDIEWLAINAASALWIAVTDLVFAVLAMLSIKRANFPFWSKVSAAALLMMGTFGGVASFVRFAMLLPHLPNTSQLGSVLVTVVTSIIEPGLIITAASLATLRPVIRSAMHNINEHYTSDDAGSGKVEKGSVKVDARPVPPARNFSSQAMMSGTNRQEKTVFNFNPGVRSFDLTSWIN